MVNLKKVLWVGILLSCICVTSMSFSAAKKPQYPLIAQLESLTTQKENALEGMLEAIIMLQNAPQDQNKILIPWLLQKQKKDTLLAPFTMQLGSRLFPNNHKDGLRWFTRGRVRLSYDASRCADPTASQVAVELSVLYGGALWQYANTHMEEFLNAWQDAITWEKKHPYSASPIWLCVQGEKLNMIPEKEWLTIRTQTLQQSQDVLKKHFAELKKQ